jgi:UDP:flavonoid glycosyltransferase YjiC (YdhE family)
MHITITAVGSRGDVQPYVALGAGFKRAGHTVCLSAPRIFSGLIAEHGLQHLPISLNPQEIVNHPAVQAAAQSGNYVGFVRALFREGTKLVKTFLEEVYANCQTGEAIIASMIPYGAYDAAEKRHRPFVQTVLAPYYPTRAFAAPGIPLPFNWGPANKLTYALIDQSFWQFFRATQNRWRQDQLGLAPFPFLGPQGQIRRQAPTVLGYSSIVVPTPADWPASNYVSGYWFLDEAPGWQPPAELVSFLQAQPTPIYIGFGSMPERDSARMTQLVLEALRLSGQRCVLLSGWAGLGNVQLPDTVYRVESIPHAWLFKRVAAVGHHGGAGTTAAGLRAGVPSMITPYTSDQFFWGPRIAELGVGPKSISYHKLTAESLAAMIRQALTDKAMRQKAAEIGKYIDSENGVEKAVAAIESYLLRCNP